MGGLSSAATLQKGSQQTGAYGTQHTLTLTLIHHKAVDVRNRSVSGDET